jgi:RimJ/RimL family protein N-acetyltransferase
VSERPTVGFESERLVMRPWTIADAEAFHRIWADPRVIFWGSASKTLEETRGALGRVIARCDEQPGLGWFAVVDRATGESVGNVVLQPAPFHAGVEIGWHFEHRVWGRGYATEAARAALAHAFGALRLEQIVAAILPDNLRSKRVAEKAGLQPIGMVTHASLLHELWEITAG